MAKKKMLAKNPDFKYYLYDAYIERRLTMAKIADELGCSAATVLNHLRKFNIPIRKASEYERKLSPEHIEIIRKRHTGKVVSEESRRKLSETRKSRKFRSPNWNGGIRRRSDGYIQTYKPDHPRACKEGYVMEHILVMCEVLNRIIEPHEVVHHINGKRNDNRPENLALFPSLRDHTIYHAYLRRKASNE